MDSSKSLRQKGLTLVELLVAMLISIVIALAAVSSLTISRRGLTTVDAAAQLGDNSRFARALLLQLGAQAGFRDVEYAATPRMPNTVGPATPAAPNVSGVNNAIPSSTDPYNSYTTRIAGSTGYGSDILILRYQAAETFPGSGVSDKTIIDCSGIRLQEKGFTLIELMVTLTIAAVLALVATPGLTAYKRNAELTSTINTLLSAINTARSEAMKRGMKAMVLPANLSQWSSGWIIFVDKDGDQVYSEANDITILTQGPPPSYFSISGTGSASGATPYILYDGSGYSRLKNGGFGALTLSLSRNDLSGSALYEQTRRLVIAKTGRVRTCKPASATDATCAANSTQ